MGKTNRDGADKGWRKMRHHSVGLELDTSCERTAALRWGKRLREPEEGQAEMGRRAGPGGEVDTRTPGSHQHIGLKGTTPT